MKEVGGRYSSFAEWEGESSFFALGAGNGSDLMLRSFNKRKKCRVLKSASLCLVSPLS